MALRLRQFLTAGLRPGLRQHFCPIRRTHRTAVHSMWHSCWNVTNQKCNTPCGFRKKNRTCDLILIKGKESEIKWESLLRWHFQYVFLNEKLWIFKWNFIEMCSPWFHWQYVIIGSDNGLAPNRPLSEAMVVFADACIRHSDSLLYFLI